MGRRGSRKNKNNNTVNNNALSRKKFRKRFCRKCGMCGPAATMRFCYNNIYKSDPKVFTEVIFPLIEKNKNRLKTMSEQLLIADFQDLQLFRTIFCLHDICTGCKGVDMLDVKSCHAAFCTQISNAVRRSDIRKNKIKKIKPKPEMYFAMYGPNSLEAEVLKILKEYNSK